MTITYGLEYTISPSQNDGFFDIYTVDPYQWTNTPIGITTPTRLVGFTVTARLYKEEEVLPPDPDPDPPDPDSLTEVIKTYLPFTVVEETLTTGDFFHEGEDFPLEPTFTEDDNTAVPVSGAVAGITDQSAYAYPKVFDQTTFALIPADYEPPLCPPVVDGSEEVDFIPLEPFDPDNDEFPYFSLTEYSPDQRTGVKVTYVHTITAASPQSGTITETINITQVVTQTIDDWSKACRYYACRGELAYKGTDYNYCPVGPINLNEYPN